MNYFDDEGTILKLKRQITKLKNALSLFADEKSWYTDYENYSTLWTRQSNPTQIAKNALKDEEFED